MLTGCSPAAKGADASRPNVVAEEGVATRAPDAAPAREESAIEPAVLAFLAAWERAQDTGDFASYAALYAAKFTGVRRSGPRIRSFDRPGWLDDRKRMFAQPMQVDFRADASSGAGSTLVVTGEQTFRSAGYEDRGQKRFVLAREPDGFHIVREEMLASELAEMPKISARFVFAIDDGGPLLVVLARAPRGAVHGAEVSSHATYLAALVYATTEVTPDGAREAAPFLNAPIQLVSADGACITKAKALRLVHLVYPHFGQLAEWRGEGAGPKAHAARLAHDIRELDPQGFWAIELESGCIDEPVLALPGGAPVVPFAHDTPQNALARGVKQRVLALPAVRGLDAADRDTLIGDLQQTRFSQGDVALVAAECSASCSVPTVAALFAAGPKPRLLFTADGSGLEHVSLVADIDGDGTAEVIGHTGIGIDTWVVRDVLGRERLRLTLPYFDCPC